MTPLTPNEKYFLCAALLAEAEELHALTGEQHGKDRAIEITEKLNLGDEFSITLALCHPEYPVSAGVIKEAINLGLLSPELIKAFRLSDELPDHQAN